MPVRKSKRSTPQQPVVAIFNTSEDTTDLLRLEVEKAGFVVITALTHQIRDGKVDFIDFLREHQPKVVVYDIALPYEENWALFEHLRQLPICREMQFVITTVNLRQVEGIAAARSQRVFEIVGKPVMSLRSTEPLDRSSHFIRRRDGNN
jgi:CheY-like chemotaxis protein